MLGVLGIIAQTISVVDVTFKAGETKVVSINLNNTQTNIVSFQMDLTLPDGITINKAGCGLGSRITDKDQELTIGKRSNGDYRLTSTSFVLKPISGTSGEIIKLCLTATSNAKGGTASLKNILFATSNSESLTAANTSFKADVTYTLTYKVDGQVYKTSTVVYGMAITPEAEPAKEGYTFSGWSEIPATMPAHDVEVNGSFAVNSYTLTYMVDGEEYKTMTVVYGTAITPEAEPAKEGYTFGGWSEIPETMPAHDVIVTGSFTINSYKLTYVIDGVEYKTVTIEYGAAITPETEPTKEGYTFSGWSSIPETMPAFDLVVKGSFILNQYTLAYIIDGEEYKSFEIDYNAVIVPMPAPVRKGMTFSGWTEIPERMPAHDVTVTGTFSWTKETINYLVYQVTDTLNNYASVIGYEEIEGKAEILPTVEIGGDIYTVNCIDRDVFAGCAGLTSVIIPESIVSIGCAAFEGCTSLQEIYCNAEQTPEVDLDAFDSVDVSSVMLVVPDNSVEEYKAHPVWGLFWIETPTGIKEIDNEQLTIDDVEYYNLNGRKLAAPQKGINIIRFSDVFRRYNGALVPKNPRTTRKVLIK